MYEKEIEKAIRGRIVSVSEGVIYVSDYNTIFTDRSYDRWVFKIEVSFGFKEGTTEAFKRHSKDVIVSAIDGGIRYVLMRHAGSTSIDKSGKYTYKITILAF